MRKSGPMDPVLQLCDFGSIPSYSTFRRAFAVLDRASELVDAAVDKISDLLQDPPWVMPAEKAAEKGKLKTGCNDYVKRQRGLRISGAAFEENILKTDPEEMRRKEKRAKEWFLEQWWPEGSPRCPDCKSADIRTIPKENPSPYKCKTCRHYFSERTGTIMQDSKLSYLIWLEALRALIRVKGMTSLQISYYLDISHSSALYLTHQIRMCLLEDPRVCQGRIQIDGTLIGGLEENKHEDKRLHNRGGAGGKVPVMGVLDPSMHHIWLAILEEADTPEFRAFLREVAPDGGEACADGHKAYKNIRKFLNISLHTVNHSKLQFVNKGWTTNGIESIWSMVKGVLSGTYGHVTEKYLALYLAEIMWRYNHQNESDEDQFRQIARNMPGRRASLEELRRATKESMPMTGKGAKGEPQQRKLMEEAATAGKGAKAAPRQPKLTEEAATAGKGAKAAPRQPKLTEEAATAGKGAKAEPRQPKLMEESATAGKGAKPYQPYLLM